MEEMIINNKDLTVIVCQCGMSTFEVVGRTKTSVKLKCKQCGYKMGVKGPVNINGEVHEPDPDYSPKKKEESDKPSEVTDIKQRRFYITDEHWPIVNRALNAMVLGHFDDQKCTEKRTSHGMALYYLCVDYLAGADMTLMGYLDEIDNVVDNELQNADTRKKEVAKAKLARQLAEKIKKGEFDNE